jgi:hypothetical protein
MMLSVLVPAENAIGLKAPNITASKQVRFVVCFSCLHRHFNLLLWCLCYVIACFDARLKASFVFFQACSPFVRTTTTQIPSNYASESAKNEAARMKSKSEEGKMRRKWEMQRQQWLQRWQARSRARALSSRSSGPSPRRFRSRSGASLMLLQKKYLTHLSLFF